VSPRVTETGAFPETARPLLEADPRATTFLDPSWLEALVAAYPRFRPFHLLLEEGGRVTGVLPAAEARPLGLREIVSLPFGTHGGPLLDPAASEAGIRMLVGRFVELTGRLRTVRFEMTVFDPPAALAGVLDAMLGRHRIEETARVLDLRPGPDALWSAYDQKLRRNVRRAQKAGIWVRRGEGEADREAFFRLYAGQAEERTIAWHHRRPRLEVLFRMLGPRSGIWLAGRGEEILCAQLVLYHEPREIHFWLSGAVRESRPLSAFHLLLHSIVQDAAERGFAACHFGASLGKPGVDRFKRAFSPVARPLVRFYHQPAWVDRIQRVRWRGHET
jgi:hypothetical protein